MVKAIIKKIYKKIKQYDTIVIARHIGPDPDAVASQIALRDSIRETFPNKKVYAVGNGVSKFKFLGHLDKINEGELKDALLIVTDVPNIHRIDGITFDKYKDVIKIDHHPIEDKMGSVEWVDTNASSASELVAELIIHSRLKLTKKVAENIFVGIVSDSNRFLLSSSRTLKLVADLIDKSKIKCNEIYPSLYRRPLCDVRFQGYIASTMTVTENGLGYMMVNPEDIAKYNVDTSTASNMINDFNYIDEVLVWTFITYDEKNDYYKINIRSRGPIINEIAGHYNGGGHALASGVRTTNKDDINKLLKELDEACKKFKGE